MGLSNTSKNNAAAAGENGSVYLIGTTALTAPAGKYFFSITFQSTTKFETTTGLIATDLSKYLNTVASASAGGTGGIVVDNTHKFAAGTTIFGQWTQIQLTDITSSLVVHIAG